MQDAILIPMIMTVSLLSVQLAAARDSAVITRLPCKVVVEAGNVDRVSTAIVVPLADSVKAESIEVRWMDPHKELLPPAQIQEGKPRTLCWMMPALTMQKGTRQAYSLTASDSRDFQAEVSVAKSEQALTLTCGGKELLQYNCKPFPAPAGTKTEAHPEVYGRTGYFHPVRTLGGKVLTCVYPGDHIHHVGLWHPWTHTEFEGRHIDFWNLRKREGTVRYVKTLGEFAGPVVGGLTVAQEHVDLKAPGGEKVVLDDVLDVRVWACRGKSYIVDYATTQSCASKSHLKIGPYRYGGFGFRTTEDWKNGRCTYLTDDGKTGKASNAVPVRWCRLQGDGGSGCAGVLFMSHPGNHEHPESTRTWGGMTKHGGFFNFNPAQKKAWVMKPGESYTSRYRVVVYDGELRPDECERLWQDYAHPPVVSVSD